MEEESALEEVAEEEEELRLRERLVAALASDGTGVGEVFCVCVSGISFGRVSNSDCDEVKT